MLNRKEIKDRDLIAKGYSTGAAKASTYDLRIDSIVDSKGVAHYDNYTLHAQEVVWVISKEIVTLPSDVTAFAHIKTGLCSVGLLALNTGIVDPGWSGPLGTPILNFGKGDRILRPGMEFLRLSFHSQIGAPVKPIVMTPPEYLAEKQDQALQNFGDKFLNANAIVLEAVWDNLLKWAGGIGVLVAVIAIVLTFCAILINSSAFYGPTYFATRGSEMAPVVQRLDALESEISKMKNQKAN